MTEKDAAIDDLDKQILQQMSKGISSYEELSRECNVTRSTIYRRVASLEKRGFMKRITSTLVNFDKLGILALCFATTVTQANHKKAVTILKAQSNVKFLWQTYGNHNLLFFVFCEKNRVGETINAAKNLLEKFGTTKTTTIIGFTWEKMDFTPFTDDQQTDKQVNLYYSTDEHVTNPQGRLKPHSRNNRFSTE